MNRQYQPGAGEALNRQTHARLLENAAEARLARTGKMAGLIQRLPQKRRFQKDSGAQIPEIQSVREKYGRTGAAPKIDWPLREIRLPPLVRERREPSGFAAAEISPDRSDQDPCQNDRTTCQLLDSRKRAEQPESPENGDERAQRERDREKAER